MIDHLPEVWRTLLEHDTCFSDIYYAEEGPSAPICICGVTAVVNDAFLRDMKTPPHFWIGPELVRRVMGGASPVLTAKELREANSHTGLNMVCWENCVRPGYEAHKELHRYLMSAFIALHRGYLWKEVIANQPESLDRLAFLLHTGAYLWDPLAGRYTSTIRMPEDIVSKPHILGVTRELEQSRQGDWAGKWVGSLFDYQAPILGLNRSEQRLLAFALPGTTDEDLANILGISLTTVKKLWVSIYRRVEDHLPELVPDPFRPGLSSNGRGREKRRHLLIYLREHPEELRPHSRKLIARAHSEMNAPAG
jgi:DNA-binding CsgD family transcriptional regulator